MRSAILALVILSECFNSGGLLMISRKLAATVILLGLSIFAQGAKSPELSFETSVDLSAADFLPAEVLQGEHHKVDDRVRNDGYLNYYTIKSDFGEFEAVSTAMLRTRIGEINALGELENLSKTEVFAKAAADAGVKQLKSIKQFAMHPVDTVTGIPAGIGRMFSRYKRQAGEAVDATQEYVASDDAESDDDEADSGDESNAAIGLTETYLGVGKAQRDWARKLGTDPYSSNEVLQAAIKEFAWAERLGKFGMGFAAVPKIPGANIISDVNRAVWSMDPYELKDLNRARLVATNATEELIEAYLENALLTPSQQTLLTAAIAELEGVSGRDGILSQTLRLEGEVEINFFIKSMTMLAWYHRNQNPVASVDTSNAIPAAILGNGATVLAFAVDHVVWTDTISKAAAEYAGLSDEGQVSEIWLLGTATERCNVELSALAVDVHSGVATMMLAEQTD